MAEPLVDEVTSKLSAIDLKDSTSSGAEADIGIYETASTKTHCKPTQVKDVFRLYYGDIRPDSKRASDSYGKWLVFEHYDKIDTTWEKIRTAIARGELGGCRSAKCTTMRYNPTKEGPGPSTTAAISVHTNEDNIDSIGYKLIQLVKRDVRFKTDEATDSYKFTHVGSDRVTEKTIYWNAGNPSTRLRGRKNYATSRDREDIWHLNVVTAPGSKSYDGWWILPMEYKKMTELWHYLKGMIERDNFGVIKMVCPPKRDRYSKVEIPVFHLYTTSEDRKSVGIKLIKFVKRDIRYEYKSQRGEKATPIEKLFWNEGKPDY